MVLKVPLVLPVQTELMESTVHKALLVLKALPVHKVLLVLTGKTVLKVPLALPVPPELMELLAHKVPLVLKVLLESTVRKDPLVHKVLPAQEVVTIKI
jgi:hypothetical protein